MDNMITGAIAVLVFAAFVVGLALSIGAVPFIIIVGIVLVLLIIDYIQSLRSGDESNHTD